MLRKLFLIFLLAGTVVAAQACAAKRPVLYPEEHLQAVGEAAAQQDIDDCLQRAAQFGRYSSAGGRVAGSTGVGAAAGAAVGAAAGAVVGRAGRGAAMGAAGGGSAGLLRGLFGSRDPDPVQKRFVEKCLREKGYQVIGWQ
jgi:outer membrane lipoprotein SlyB